MAGKSRHIEELPIELLHHAISHLLPTHNANRSTLEADAPSPLLDVAASSRTLCRAVESYSRTTLLQWSTVTKFRGQMPKSKTANVSHRGFLLRWKRSHCVWCGKKSQRKAILCNGFGCCSACDKKQWPEKITKTKAKQEYHLSEDQLFAETGDGLPIISYGSYTVEGVVATLFLRADVEMLAGAVHGDWKAHMQARAARGAAIRKKQLATIAGKAEAAAAAAAAVTAAASPTSSHSSGESGLERVQQDTTGAELW